MTESGFKGLLFQKVVNSELLKLTEDSDLHMSARLRKS